LAQVEGKKSAIEIELNERLRRRREELRLKIDALAIAEGDEAASADDLEARTRELKTLNNSIQALTRKTQGWFTCLLCVSFYSHAPEMERESDELSTHIQDLQKQLENVQSQQTEDSRNISRQQKTTERYLAKKQMLTGRRDECNRNIRDLGVLPEEAFEKYTNEKMDRVGYEDLLLLNAN